MSARRTLPPLAGLLAGALAAVAFAGPASSAETVAPNACKYAIDGYWRSLGIRMAATAAPVYVPPGAAFRLQGAAVAAAFPDWIAEYGFNLGHLSAGVNRVPAEVWVAVAGRGSTQGVQVLKGTVTAETTVSTTPDGEQFRGATPLQVTVPLSDSVWTAPTEEGGRVTFGQAPPKSLPSIPGRNGGTATVPQGSIFIRAALSNNTIFDLDCQPGRGSADGNSFSPGGILPFEVAYVDPNAEATGIEAPVVASPAVTVVSTALRTNRKRTSVPIKLRNGGLITAKGQIKVTTSGKQRTSRKARPRVLTLANWKTYKVNAQKTKTVALKPSSDLRRLLKTKKSVRLRVSVRPATGRTTASGAAKYGKTTTTVLTLKR